MNGGLGHICAYVGWTGPGERPEKRHDMPSKHMIRNSHSGGLRPSPLPPSHGSSPQYWIVITWMNIIEWIKSIKWTIKENKVNKVKKADLLNNKFRSVFGAVDPDERLLNVSGKSYPDIFNLHITVEGVEKQLQNLVSSKASGPDQIPNMYLKSTAEQTAPF